MEKRIRILVAKPGLDGHDRGAKVVAQALRDAGMGSHLYGPTPDGRPDCEYCPPGGCGCDRSFHHVRRPLYPSVKTDEKDEGQKMEETLVVVGGVIPKRDLLPLQKMGIRGIFPGGTPFDQSIQWIKEHSAPDPHRGKS